MLLFDISFDTPSGRTHKFRNDNLGIVFRQMIEATFYNECKKRFDLDVNEVRIAINAAQHAETREEEIAANADRLFSVFNEIVEQINKELRFSANGLNWAKLSVEHS